MYRGGCCGWRGGVSGDVAEAGGAGLTGWGVDVEAGLEATATAEVS